jgi:hypothetical protein
MKNNQLIAILVGLLFLSTLCGGAIVFQYNLEYRKGQRLETEIKQITEIEKVVTMLSADTVEYSKATKNPDMARLLQTLEAPKTVAKPAK